MNKFFRALAMSGLALVVMGSQVGCKGLAEKLAKKADAGAGAAGTTANLDNDEVLDELVDCLNGLDHSISNSLDRYQSWLPHDKEGKPLPPTGKERTVYSPYEIHASSSTQCAKGLAAAANNATFKDVAAKYKAVTDKIVPEINAAYKYYDRDDYKDDKFEKAKTIHSTLWPLAEEFEKVSKEFRTVVVKANDTRLDQQMQEIEKEMGRNLVFQKFNVMKFAKAAVAVGTDEKASAADLETVTTAYETAMNEMNTYATAHKDEVDKAMMWSSFDSEAEDYLKALKSRLRRVRDKTPYSTGEKLMINNGNDEMVEGSPGKVNREYNELVNRSNSVKFR